MTLLREIDNRTHDDVHKYHEAAIEALRARNRELIGAMAELELRHTLTLAFLEHDDEIGACFAH